MELEDYRWLLGAEHWLARAAADPREPVVVVDSLRRELTAGRAALVLQQVELRRRGRAKFADAPRMFFTPRGLEQATDQAVAAHKAGRFDRDRLVLDLCSGIGGDLAALAARATAVGFDRDPVAALLAAANLAALGLPARLAVADVTRLAIPPEAAWHIDPDRRPSGRRSVQPRWHEPGEDEIERLLRAAPHGAVKLAPATAVPPAWRDRAELEWISRGRQCRQLVAWFGRLAREPGSRRACIIKSRDPASPGEVRTLAAGPARGLTSDDVNAPVYVAERPERWVFEPDPAVLAAGLTGVLAAEHGLAALAPASVYLTGPLPVDDLALACFEVQDVLPFDRKRVARLLADRRIGRLEVKSRGLPHDPERLRRELRGKGEESATLILARRPSGVLAILARRRV